MKEHIWKFDFKNFFIKYEEDVVTLSDLGWTIPVEMTPAEVSNLLELSTIQQMDDFFIDYYESRAFTNFNFMVQDLLKSKFLYKWSTIIGECIESYREGRYTITIPSLILVVEGLIAMLSSSDEIKIIKMCKEKVEQHEVGTLDRVLWKSIYRFISNLFSNRRFNEDRLELINRHWILHGRDTSAWNKSDALRLFNCLNTLILAAE
jgi:hypothetical protein